MSISSFAKHSLRSGVGFSLQMSGLFRLLEGSLQSPWPRILYYHRVSEDPSGANLGLSVSATSFDRQMQFLSDHYRVISVDALVEKWNAGDRDPRDVAITFDDGYRDNYDCAFPTLRKYGLPATIFLTTDYLGGATLLWWDRMHYLLTRARRQGPTTVQAEPALPESVLTPVNRYLAAGGTDALTSAINALKSLGRPQRLAAIDAFTRVLNPRGEWPTERLFLTWDEVRQMSTRGIDFGSHTCSHPVLTELDSRELLDELARSKNQIEEMLGRPVKGIAYPDGCFSDEVKTVATQLGYRWALQTRRYLKDYDGLAIPRIRIVDGHSRGPLGGFSPSAFALEVSELANRLLLRDARSSNPYQNQSQAAVGD
jgi:peptidoglycan/xylan/chitin deacetylase (PgdA/CDA1 family)